MNKHLVAGDYFVNRVCTRCNEDEFFHAMQNTPPEDIGCPFLCSWCKGKCSAAEQEWRNESAREYNKERSVQ